MNHFTDEPSPNIPAIRIPLDSRGWVTRRVVQSRHDCVFLYGHDFVGAGMSGQAYEVHGEPNSFPIFTVYKLCPSGKHYFDDGTFDLYAKIIDQSIEELPRDSRPIIPLAKIGCGGSELVKRAPRLFAYLQRRLMQVCYQNVIWEMPQAGVLNAAGVAFRSKMKDWLL